MNKPHFFVRWCLCALVLTFAFLPLVAQLNVSVNRADAIYNVGETAFFQVNATFSGTASYEIIYDNEAPVITSGTINVNGGQTASIPYNHNEPGIVLCRVNLNGIVQEAAAAFSPLEISPLEEEPGDFDSFWASQRNLKNSLPIDPQISYHNESSYQTTYTFSLANIEGRRTYGYISVPKGSGPFPASITLPPYGSSNAVVGADTESAEKGGMIAVSISIHNSPVNQDDPNAYSPDVNTNRDQFYYRYALVGAMHVIDYLETRPDFDGNVCAMGVSQGGGLSILLAGIDNRVSLLINSNPTMGQHVGYKYDRASGFPYYLSIIDDMNQGNTSVFNQGVNATKYYDAMFHARRFQGASYSLTGFKDMVVPSATALVSHNQLPGTKVLMISRDGGHDHPNEYWNGRFEFMRRHFAGSNNPPFQFGSTNKGFFANAGNDQTVGTSANLNGQIFYDNDQLNNLSVSWKKVTGPGNVNFSNSNGYNTTANFSSNGTYVLQFTGRDDRKLNSEGKIYYISDDVIINVTGGGNPTFTLNLSCPSIQIVEIPAGQSQTNVNWSDPVATSNCSGGASYFQLAGPQNGSAFSQGTYTITYRASDNCGNQEDCSFTITVNQGQVDNSDITLNCPSDIVVDAPAGDNAVTVSWAEPTASTTCNNGGNTGGGDCSSTFKSGFTYMGTFDNSQFYLSNNGANWTDARQAAENAGGRLAIINSASENDFIQQNINNEIVFIGLSDVNQEGNLQWVDGSSVGYNKYVSGLNNNDDNDFVTLYPWNGEWDLNNQFVVKKYVLEAPCSSGGGGGGNGVTLTQTNGLTNGSNFTVGTTSVTYSATDNCGNSKTCSFNVTVNSTASSLSIICPSDMSVQIPAGQSTTSVTWAPASANSNCSGGVTVTQIAGNGNGNQFASGNYTITYQATDNCGNSEICSFNINVSSSPTDLSISCPANQVVQIPSGQTQVQVSWNQPSASTSCPNGASVNQISGPSNFSSLGAGNYTISYEATDNCGNSETCSFSITVNEAQTTSLSINCPADQTLELPQGQTEMPLNWPDPTASTNCSGGSNINQTGGAPKFSVLGIGVYFINYEATDNCGNREICSFVVSIVANNSGGNNSNLSLDCPSDIVMNIPANQSAKVISWTAPSATTTCTSGGGGNDCNSTNINGYSYLGEFQGSQYYKSNSPLSFPLAKDAVENAGGNLVKIASAEENEFLRQNIGTDLCIIGVSDEETEGVWKWTDGSNASYLNFPSNINNNFSDDYGVMNFWNGEWELTTDFIYKKYILEIPCSGNSGGNGGVSVNQTGGPASGSSFGVGTTIVTYQATDDCGNSETCSFNVTINQDAPDNNDGPPTATVSVTSTTVSDDFQVTINFNEPVTGLSGYDLSISNANWYNFNTNNNTFFTLMLDPINAGNVSIQVPTDVAFDSDIQGNLASNTINVNYQPGGANPGGGGNPPAPSGNCIISPTSVTLEDGQSVGGNVNNLINGTGLTAQDDINAQHGGGSLYDGVWLNDGTEATLRFDLGSPQTIDGIALWNYSYHTWLVLKRRGVKDFLISTSNDGVNYSATTFHSAVQTTDRGMKENVQVFNIPTVTARYVRLHILSALDDSFYVGLGEVRMTNNCSAVLLARENEEEVEVEPFSFFTMEEQLPEISAIVYPNPTTETFFIDVNTDYQGNAIIQVINEVGAIIQKHQTATNSLTPLRIDLGNQSDGLYLVRILAEGAAPITKKVIKTSRY